MIHHPWKVLSCSLLLIGLLTANNVWAQAKNPYAGDAKMAKLGEFEFRANCAFCHGLGGRGGGRGPDLTGAGTARSTDYLVESVRKPSRRLAQGLIEAMKEFSAEYETVNVVTSDGTKYQGTLLNEDSFTVQFIDTRENVHSFDKSSLKSMQKSRESIMPAYDEKMLPDKDLQDLLAFMVSGGAGGAK